MKLHLILVLIPLLVIGLFPISQYFSFLSYAQTSAQGVELKSHKITNDNRLIGQVQNNAGQNVTFVEIIATFYDQNGNISETEDTYSNPQDLKPGMKAPFEIHLDDNLVNTLNSYDLMVNWQNLNEIEETKVYEFTTNSTL
jgi:hypothetical protein